MKALVAIACSLTSVGAVLAHLYGVMPMHRFALFVTAPAMLLLIALGVTDRAFGRRLAIGAWAGLWATIAYDLLTSLSQRVNRVYH